MIVAGFSEAAILQKKYLHGRGQEKGPLLMRLEGGIEEAMLGDLHAQNIRTPYRREFAAGRCTVDDVDKVVQSLKEREITEEIAFRRTEQLSRSDNTHLGIPCLVALGCQEN